MSDSTSDNSGSGGGSGNGNAGSLATASQAAILALVIIAGIPLAMTQWGEMALMRSRDTARLAHLKEAGRHVMEERFDLATVGYRKAATAMGSDPATQRATDHLLILNAVRNPQTLVGRGLSEIEYIAGHALSRSQPPAYAQYYQSARGAVRSVQGRIDEALADFDAAIATDADFAPAHYFKGKVLADTGRPKDAQPALERAIALDGRLLVAHKRLAQLLIDGGDLDGAAARLKTVLDDEQLPSDAEAHYLMGLVKGKQQDHESAREQFMAGFRINPAFPNLKRALGITMFKLKRYKDAVQILQQAYEESRDINVYYFIGAALMELKEYQQAANIFQAIINNRPEHAEARFDLATLLDSGKQLETAVAHYQAFLQIIEKSGRKDLAKEARTAKARIDAYRQATGGK